MTNFIKISQLPAATTPLTGAEDVALVQGGVTKQATVAQIAAAIGVTIYASRASAVTAIATLAPDVNRIGWLAPNSRVYFVYRLALSISISDMLGWYPEGVITPFHYGAVGDGAADDYAACQAALNTGLDVCFPKPPTRYRIATELELTANGQRAYSNDNAEIRQVTTDEHVIKAVSKTGCGVYGLTLYAAGTFLSYDTGAGAFFQGCFAATVRGVTVKNHRGAGVCFYNTSNSLAFGNTFTDSPVLDTDIDAQAFADVAVVHGGSGNRIIANDCRSGQGTAVLVQSVSAGQEVNQNIISHNNIDGYKVYGIVAYRNDQSLPLTQEVKGTAITGNTIRNISGRLINSITSTYPYGAGIYIQGGEGTAITGNTVEFTHTASVTFVETLSPAAIGITNVTRVTCTGNTVNDCGMLGIEITEGNNFGDALGYAVISGNIVSRTAQAGIRLRSRGRVVIANNGIDTTGAHGIRVQNASPYADILVSMNAAKNTGNTGITVDYADNCSVVSNIIDGSAVAGVVAANCNNINTNDNNITNHTTRGIQIASTCVGASVLNNTIRGTGSSTEGIRLDAKATVDRTNRISGCTTAWVGNFAVLRGFNTAAFLFTATTVETDIATFTVPASSLVVNGDGLKFSAFGSTRNSADTKTLRVYVGSAMVFGTTLTTSQLSPWRLEFEIVRRTTNSQRCFVQMVQGGTTTKLAGNYALTSETETSAIVVRVTGQGTVSNDIECYNLNSEFVQAA